MYTASKYVFFNTNYSNVYSNLMVSTWSVEYRNGVKYEILLRYELQINCKGV